jgi:hypothetical protein
MMDELFSDFLNDESLEDELPASMDAVTLETEDDAALDFGNTETAESRGPQKEVAVDWIEFEGALENNSPDLKSFLNLLTGDVIRVFEGEAGELSIEEAESSDDYLLIDPISSREQYRWMEEFIEVIEDATLKDKLNIAIDGKGAFRRFKDVLMGYPTERERWFAKRSAKLHTHMAGWLESQNIVPLNTPPWEAPQDGQQKRNDDRRAKGEGDTRSWREGASDLRAVAHDLLDIVPSRELPTAVAFLEFLKGRRGHRRSSRA